MKVTCWSLALFIVLAFYLVLCQTNIQDIGMINYEDLNSLSKDQLETLHSHILLSADNQIISEKDFSALSKKKQKIIITWLITNSKTTAWQNSEPESMEQCFMDGRGSLYTMWD